MSRSTTQGGPPPPPPLESEEQKPQVHPVIQGGLEDLQHLRTYLETFRQAHRIPVSVFGAFLQQAAAEMGVMSVLSFEAHRADFEKVSKARGTAEAPETEQ